MKNIYILYSCDAWKSNNSMSIIVATTSIRKLKSIIVKEIEEGNIEYERYDNITAKNQAKALIKDWSENGPEYIFANLKYGYVEVFVDGEVQ